MLFLMYLGGFSVITGATLLGIANEALCDSLMGGGMALLVVSSVISWREHERSKASANRWLREMRERDRRTKP